MLATSRTPLHAYGEREYPLAPLPLPDPAHLPPLERLSQYEAVRLFVERAQAVKPDFTVTNANAPAVAEICSSPRRPPAGDRAGRGARQDAPTAGAARAPGEALAAADRRRPRRSRRGSRRCATPLPGATTCSTPRSRPSSAGWRSSPAAARSRRPRRSLNLEGTLDVFGGIASLVDKSLLRQEEGIEGEPRFRMLETVREYGLERLEASGDADAVRQRHAAYFAAMGVAGNTQVELWLAMTATLDRVERDMDNLRAAMAWAEQTGDAKTGLVVANTFANLVFQRGQLAEGREWLTRLLALDADVPIAIRALAVCNLGWIAMFQGDLDAAEAAAVQAVDLAATEPPVLTSSLNLLACTLWDRGLLTEARQRFEESLAVARTDTEANALLPMMLGNFGVFTQIHGTRQEARDAYEAALAALPATDVSFAQPLHLGNLAQLAWEDGDHLRSASLTLEALRLGRKVRNGFVVANTLDIAARHVLAADRPHVAARFLGAADGLRRRAGVAVELQTVAEREALVAQVRQILGEEATQAWSEGEALSLDQASSEAMDVMTEVMSQSASASFRPSN